MNITRKLKQVTILIYKDRFVPSLKQMTNFFSLAVDISRITEPKVLNDSGQRSVANLYQQVNMIGHQTEGMHPMSISFNALLK